jgi:SET domain-containing protein
MTSLQIRSSNGVGVFAKKAIAKDIVVTEYAGLVIQEEGKRYGTCTFHEFLVDDINDDVIGFLMTHQQYKIQMSERESLYGFNFKELMTHYKKDLYNCCGSLVNHSDSPNCVLARSASDADLWMIVSTRNIKPEEEITVNYGSGYWQSREDDASRQWVVNDIINRGIDVKNNIREFLKEQFPQLTEKEIMDDIKQPVAW